MRVGVLEVEFLLPGTGSLKEKRRIVRSLTDRIAHRFNVSVAEVDYQDRWGRCLLGCACVGTDGGTALKELQKIENLVEAEPEIQLVRLEKDVL